MGEELNVAQINSIWAGLVSRKINISELAQNLKIKEQIILAATV
jgi:hypothetical protein